MAHGQAAIGGDGNRAPTWLDGNTTRSTSRCHLKDTEGLEQKLTLQAWLAGRAHLVATSHERDLDHALAEVHIDLIRQIEEEKSLPEPRKRPEDALSHDLTGWDAGAATKRGLRDLRIALSVLNRRQSLWIRCVVA